MVAIGECKSVRSEAGYSVDRNPHTAGVALSFPERPRVYLDFFCGSEVCDPNAIHDSFSYEEFEPDRVPPFFTRKEFSGAQMKSGGDMQQIDEAMAVADRAIGQVRI
jgi:hypothetical protein